MTPEQIAAKLAQHLWMYSVEFEVESREKQFIQFATQTGVPLFSIIIQRQSVENWRVIGVRFDIEDEMKDLTEVVHG